MVWPLIEKNSIIDIVAPSGKIEPENIPQIDAYVRSLGLIPRIPENLLGDHPFSANADEIRFQHLRNALYAEDSTLIWCARGGHGVTTIMHELIKLPKPNKQKLLVGFSDITSLHLWFNQTWQWPSLHGPMVRQNASGKSNPLDMNAETKIFFEGIADYQFGALTPLNKMAQQLKQLEGVTAGSCVSLLQTSMGTPWHIQTEDKILVLEDINESAYRTDRLLIHLTNAAVFQQAKAVIFGDFGENPVIVEQMKQVLDHFANQWLVKHGINIPVYRIDGFGHGLRNKPLPLGVSAKLITHSNESYLQF